MVGSLMRNGSLRVVTALTVLATAVLAAFAAPTPASAHCDSEKGPVAQAAMKALEANNVNLVLPYVQPDAEAELTAAFKHVMQVRKGGGGSKELADRYFLETAIRLHRLGEGASYEGMTSEAVPAPILTADRAMASGLLDPLYKMLDQAIRKSVAEKYQAVVQAREEAAKLGTVEAFREQAEAELVFEKFIYELYGAASLAQPHAEGQAPAHAH